ncbi:hypothetical protein CERSUDRAFT_120210 [Gelatoporia subvermispora B]|uniref:Uncharacterized protein n=1 Tax=Ceriporiopsis subvermispora (strain B) TaxID=914234 RepID=M2QWW6_CERS8|nr:hypothetical protein CERSUDRAFT_120210 [Gelatoporia subvermispora B]
MLPALAWTLATGSIALGPTAWRSSHLLDPHTHYSPSHRRHLIRAARIRVGVASRVGWCGDGWLAVACVVRLSQPRLRYQCCRSSPPWTSLVPAEPIVMPSPRSTPQIKAEGTTQSIEAKDEREDFAKV